MTLLPGDAGTLALAYALLGLALGAYLLHLGRKLEALRRDVRDLQSGEESSK